MTSFRLQVVRKLVERLSALAGWDVRMRGFTNETDPDATVAAVVWFVGEDKTIAVASHYQATAQIAVDIVVGIEAIDALQDPEGAFALLDRMVVLAEKVVHAPDTWTGMPDVDVTINGHETIGITESDTQAKARLRLTLKYRHTIESPEGAF